MPFGDGDILSWRKNIRNTRIRKITKVEHTLVDNIQSKQLVWCDHLQRIEDDKLPKRVIKRNPTGRRGREGSQNSWIKGVEQEMYPGICEVTGENGD